MSTNETHVWADYGMSWGEEIVSRQAGPNKTDRVAFHTKAQLPKIDDYAKFVAHFGETTVLAFINASNSIRVRAQAVCRGAIEDGVKDVSELRQRVYNAMRGIRAQGAVQVVTKIVHSLPDGTTYEGTDLVEYQQLYVAALVEQGVPAAIATGIAINMKLS